MNLSKLTAIAIIILMANAVVSGENMSDQDKQKLYKNL